ncbi:MAG TPA: hypothetical protein VKV29_00075, partial [Chthonomonas sp.]|uniref:tetratricopeptide repeat protein n=1 Tax=Chthonomonas sp. TaxID=2282153 RepID=UPI002B4B8BCD
MTVSKQSRWIYSTFVVLAFAVAMWVRVKYTDPPSLMRRYMDAVHLAEAGDYVHAVAIWQRLLVEYPSFPYTYFQLGRFYAR